MTANGNLRLAAQPSIIYNARDRNEPQEVLRFLALEDLRWFREVLRQRYRWIFFQRLLRGLMEIVEAPPFLRHFSARMRQL